MMKSNYCVWGSCQYDDIAEFYHILMKSKDIIVELNNKKIKVKFDKIRNWKQTKELGVMKYEK